MSKIALVLGCGSNVWEDAQRAIELCDFDAVCCVKQMGIHWEGNFDVWATLHPEVMDSYEAERKKLGYPGEYEIVAPLPEQLGEHGKKGKIARRVSYQWPGMNASASSGIYGVKVMVDAGYNVIMAGIPMDASGGHFLPKSKNVMGAVRGDIWKHRDSFIPGFKIALPFMMGRVKSMSGYTKEQLGAPTREWLKEISA